MQTIMVSWDDHAQAPVAPDVTIDTASGAVVIRWEGDASMGAITGISGLPSGPEDDFTAPRNTGPKRWTCTTGARARGAWRYRISGTPASGGTVGSRDQIIRNDRIERPQG